MTSELFPMASQPAGEGSQAEQGEVFLVTLRVACVSHDCGGLDDERAEEGRVTEEACDATKADGDTFGRTAPGLDIADDFPSSVARY